MGGTPSLLDITLLGPLRNNENVSPDSDRIVEEPQSNDLGSSSSTPPPPPRNLARNLALLCER